MKLIVTIPAFNEEKTIGRVVKSVPGHIEGVNDIKILVVNDGSTDSTAEEATKAGAQVLTNRHNKGLARTFNAGLQTALAKGADIIVNTDADNQYNQAEISKLIQPIIKGGADIVIGDRQIKKLKFMKFGNRYGNLLGSWIVRVLTGANVNDASSGFRAFTREAALKLNINFNHTYTHETIIQAKNKNLKITNVPIEFRERLEGESKLIRNLFSHIRLSAIVIIRSILLYKPLKILLYLGSAIMAPGIIIGARFIYFFIHGIGQGKIQSLILASILIILGFLIMILGLIGDLIANNRRLNEEILYEVKKNGKIF